MLRPTGTLVTMAKSTKSAPLQLEDHVPVPGPMGKYRFGEVEKTYETMNMMEVGQSFVLPIGRKTYLSMAKTISKKTNKLFISRSMGKGKDAVVRVWRVK